MIRATFVKLIVLLGATAFYTQLAQAQGFVFSAPPRGPVAKESAVYKPIADYLSAVLKKKVIYEHPGNWLTYQKEMQQGRYDLVFDGPHFVSWRMAAVQHEPLVKLPGKLAFTVITRKDNTSIQKVEQLRGRTVCGLAPPNLATLTLYSLFPNPARQPIVKEVKSFPEAYKQTMKGKCTAAVMRDKMFFKLDKKNPRGRIIIHTKGIANQAFSAGPRFSAEDKQRIVGALLDPGAKQKMKAFHARFNKKGKPLQRATREEYHAHAKLLKDVWGFDIASR